jgi:1-acyl-sn-glycerol-3-phosphate acyltransferase
MWNPQTMELMPGFWRPRPNRFWNAALAPMRHYYLRRYYGITNIRIEGAERVRPLLEAGEGVLIAPNHSNDSDPHVMIELGQRLGRQLYFMAAWQVFTGHGGIDGLRPSGDATGDGTADRGQAAGRVSRRGNLSHE